MPLREWLRERKTALLTFAAAASVAPTAGIALAAPCGLVCGACPLGGACLAASPIIFGGVLIAQKIASRNSSEPTVDQAPRDDADLEYEE